MCVPCVWIRELNWGPLSSSLHTLTSLKSSFVLSSGMIDTHQHAINWIFLSLMAGEFLKISFLS